MEYKTRKSDKFYINEAREALKNANYFTISIFEGRGVYKTTTYQTLEDLKNGVSVIEKDGVRACYYIVTNPYNISININGTIHLL